MLCRDVSTPRKKSRKYRFPTKIKSNQFKLAVDKYREANGGLLPIKTRDMETPIYLKYPIEFSKLDTTIIYRHHLEMRLRVVAIFQYVLIDVETNPTVKVV